MSEAQAEPPAPEAPAMVPVPVETISETIEGLAAGRYGAPLTLATIVGAFGVRAMPALIFMLALPNSIPVSIPGASAPFGAAILVFLGQMALGRTHPWIPERLRALTIQPQHMQMIAQFCGPRIRWVERRLGRQGGTMASEATPVSPFGRFASVVMMAWLAFLLFLPLPAFNAPPAWGIAVLALGLAYQSSRIVAVGLIVSLLATLALIALAVVAWSFLQPGVCEALGWFTDSSLGLCNPLPGAPLPRL